jgi:uncharacterized protein (TIGR04255 family)
VFELPDPGRYRLDGAPLVQALAQVRFPLVAHLRAIEGIARLQDELRDMFPFMERKDVQGISLLIGPSGAAPSDVQQNVIWEFTQDEGPRLQLDAGVATLMADDQYEGVESFADAFGRILEAMAAVEGIRRCDRLGVRFINVASLPADDPMTWTRWFRPELANWLGANVLNAEAHVHSSIVQTTLSAPGARFADAPGDVQAIFRHGYAPQASALPGLDSPLEDDSFLLDMDVAVSTPQAFVPNRLKQQFLAFHGEIDRFFRWTLSDGGKEHFGLREVG